MDLLLEWKEGDTAGANEAAATVGAEMLTNQIQVEMDLGTL